MKQRVRELIQAGDRLFEQRDPMLSLWQEIAENFYPERADFRMQRSMGQEFASHLMTGAPVMVRRDLANQFAAMLRPRGKNWFEMSVGDEETSNDASAKAWLEDRAGIMRRAMYDTSARFIRATKEGDHDFAAFGQCVLTVDMNRNLDGLLYRSWHLRDVVWAENAELEIDTIHRHWTLPARVLATMFPNKVHEDVRRMAEKEPFRDVKCRHIIVSSDDYDFSDGVSGRKRGTKMPFVSLYVDKEHETILEEIPVPDHPYIIPRWQTVSGSQYAHSPATVVGLADARLLQRITLTLLEAGEKAVNPPVIGVQEALRGDVNLYAGGITMLDMEYDERTGEALRPLELGSKSGLAFGEKMADRYMELLKSAFYLDKINLPPAGDAMTATEVRSRIEEYIRAALPLFEPLETEYNGALCEKTFSLMLRHGGFGPVDQIPGSLGGQEIKFTFQSPLQVAADRDKATAFQEAGQLLAMAAQIDPDAPLELDIRTAFRDALNGVQVPAKWITPDEQSQKLRQQANESRQAATAAQQVQAGAQVATDVAGAAQTTGDAATALQQAGLVPQAGELAGVSGAPGY